LLLVLPVARTVALLNHHFVCMWGLYAGRVAPCKLPVAAE
jgi:hypothetical protein